MRPSSALDRRLHELEARLEKRILVRPVHSQDRNFRGRIALIPAAIVLEYQDDTAGYFWDSDIIGELLDHLAAGGREITLYTADASSEGPA